MNKIINATKDAKMAHILSSVLEVLGLAKIQHFIIVWADDIKIKLRTENITKNTKK